MFEVCILGLQQNVCDNLFDVNTFLPNHANPVSRFVDMSQKKRLINAIHYHYHYHLDLYYIHILLSTL